MEELKQFRESQGKSRKEMAEILGISHSMYEKIELGDRMVSAGFVRKLKQVFPTFDVNIFFNR